LPFDSSFGAAGGANSLRALYTSHFDLALFGAHRHSMLRIAAATVSGRAALHRFSPKTANAPDYRCLSATLLA